MHGEPLFILMLTRIYQTVNSRFSRSYFNLYFNEHIDQINRSERLNEYLG